MEKTVENYTLQLEFHLLAFSNSVDIEVVLLVGIILMYILTVLGNLVIITLICLVPQLHTPMYFFLHNMSVQDIVYITSILPKLMDITVTGNTSISYLGCMTQMFLSSFCVVTEFLLLTSMAYDRYVAICKPLHYSIIMSNKLCFLLSSASWFISFFNSLLTSLVMSDLLFCNSQDINHFFCDTKTIMERSCSDITTMMNIIFVEDFLFGFLPFILIILSYVNIITTILKIQTSDRRLKTFSSCSSHITVVIILYGSVLALYVQPESKQSLEQNKILSLLYVTVVPLLNPLVYTLKNQEVHIAFTKVINTYLNTNIHKIT